MEFLAVIVAAGTGERAGAGLAKQWRPVAGMPMIRWSARALLAAGARKLVVVIAPGAEPLAADALAGLEGVETTHGGATRAHSVVAGLDALDAADTDTVLIHDAARPFLTADHIARLVRAIETGADGAIPALPVADTLKRRNEVTQPLSTVSRDGLWRAQTPQAFRFGVLRTAFEAWDEDFAPTDDAEVVEKARGRVALVAGDPMLMKLTYPEDFAMAERLVGEAQAVRVPTVRVGQGFDVHAFGRGDAVWLCGVRIPHNKALVGHSDADAGLHALTDALLGAIGEGDIGDHFPPSDPKWKGASSDRFLLHAAELVSARGGRITGVDVTLICEAPRIGPHRSAMRARLAELLGLDVSCVSVKATTTEKLGFTGRGQGLAAQAIATVELPAG